jgi:hypothetical protein
LGRRIGLILRLCRSGLRRLRCIHRLLVRWRLTLGDRKLLQVEITRLRAFL